MEPAGSVRAHTVRTLATIGWRQVVFLLLPSLRLLWTGREEARERFCL